MQKYEIKKQEAGQRLDKFLHKFMPQASTSFFYKMLRKKNITLNGMKVEGKELLTEGDVVSFFFSDETFLKFRGADTLKPSVAEYEKAYHIIKGIQIIYEDPDVLILNKPAGILSQKAKPEDLSLNEWLIGYLLNTGAISSDELSTFKPSVCNRLDRNTSGLVLCGKSLKGSQHLTALIRNREVKKFYHTIVVGKMEHGALIEGYLYKDEKTNKVTVYSAGAKDIPKEAQEIKTSYKPVESMGEYTLLEVELITGKTHQIRAHLASIGHPIVGDPKYGNQKTNRLLGERAGLKWQLLHAYRLEFPDMKEGLTSLSGKAILAEKPEIFHHIQP